MKRDKENLNHRRTTSSAPLTPRNESQKNKIWPEQNNMNAEFGCALDELFEPKGSKKKKQKKQNGDKEK